MTKIPRNGLGFQICFERLPVACFILLPTVKAWMFHPFQIVSPENCSMRSILSLLAVAVLSAVVEPQSADAGLFGCFKPKSSCCEPCCPVPEPCCAPAPTCCAPEPVCCEPVQCCDPCSKPHCGLFSGMFKKCFRRHHSCASCCPAPEPCCPAPVSCCAPAPCCGM